MGFYMGKWSGKKFIYDIAYTQKGTGAYKWYHYYYYYYYYYSSCNSNYLKL